MANLNTYDEFTVLHLKSNDVNRTFQELISRSVVIHDDQRMGALYIQAHLEKCFPIQGFQ
jgi:hypothetical protein